MGFLGFDRFGAWLQVLVARSTGEPQSAEYRGDCLGYGFEAYGQLLQKSRLGTRGGGGGGLCHIERAREINEGNIHN